MAEAVNQTQNVCAQPKRTGGFPYPKPYSLWQHQEAHQSLDNKWQATEREPYLIQDGLVEEQGGCETQPQEGEDPKSREVRIMFIVRNLLDLSLAKEKKRLPRQ